MGRPQDTTFNLAKALRFVPPDAADEIRAFREAQNGLTPKQRWERCQKKRDGLLESHTKLASVFACYGILFRTERRHRHSDEAWQDFDAVIREQEASRRLRCLVVISDKWGEEVVRHYGFSSRPRRYCDDLRTVANLCPAWRDAATRLNNSMCQRLQSTDRRIPGVSNAINPIESWDLQHVKTAACREPMPHNLEIPHGYGLDRFGLLVHQDIAAASADMSNNNTTHNPMPDQNRATFVSATAAHIASDPPPISCTGLFPPEAAQSLPAPSMTDIRTEGGNALPFPPSPPSSPDTGPATSLLLTAESEQRLPSNGKRAAAKHLDRATKKQRTLSTGPSATATNLSDSSARSDAREILGKLRPCSPPLSALADRHDIDLLAKLQSRGSSLTDQPQFAQSLEWARAESEKDERTHQETTTDNRHSAPSFLERVLLPSLGRQDASQSSQQGPVPPNRVLPPALSSNPSQAGQVRAGQRSESQGSDGFQDGKYNA
ncbi:hypothetical protein MGU_11478 [Metarhizium guizhouense ARSEF 977]|uniref:Uncharacterized protein n=1 Tax=Metarhizium guizhouense (strain ARSEF 977) TaxID=1276136 RepID=A0A0B4GN51_METGA|nr:hypothetical protein MGU_11478 [Metarhizium guizhouense ARSEF 977]